MSKRAGIAGAGLMGRVLAEWLTSAGWDVTLYDAGADTGEAACAYTGAGMLAPWCELEHAAPLIARLGCRSLDLWPTIVARLAEPVFRQREGSLVVAHPNDREELRRLRAQVASQAPADAMLDVDAARLGELEPELAGHFAGGLYFPSEGQIDNRQLLDSLRATLRQRGVVWHVRTPVERVAPGVLVVGGREERFDWAIDCRGLGAKEAQPALRGVRGELVRVHAPEVHLQRPVRLMHPRYPLYIVPREEQRYVIGATSIESEDRGPVTVRSLLELLSAAYTVHSGFAEARVLETAADCRPSFPDNLPRLDVAPGLLRINGLYRHGFLLAPALAEAAHAILTGAPPGELARTILKEITP